MQQPSSKAEPSQKIPLRIILCRGERASSFTVRPSVAIAAVAGCLLLMTGYLGAAGYMMLRDDVPSGRVAAERAQLRIYQDRIAQLRARIDRITSRSMVARHTYESEIDALKRRQGEIDARHARVADVLARAARTGLAIAAAEPLPPTKPLASIEQARASDLPESIEAARIDTTPAPLDGFGLRGTMAGPSHKTDRKPRPLVQPTSTPSGPEPAVAKSDKMVMGRIENALDVMDRQSATALDVIAVTAEHHIARIERVTRSLGLPLGNRDEDAVGGPYEPLTTDDSFNDRLLRAERAVDRLSTLRDGVRSLPLAMPLDGTLSVSSPYGARVDPFLGTPAMHTGVDLRAPYGAPIHATAAGTVVSAGRNGGYGLMVEIDHGNGIVTRYGHMSRVFVSAGQKVSVGAVIGQVGSTGRSTGAHLHYETRLSSGPLDPETFLTAGEKLAGIL
ncbi:peptidase M23-like protein [Breoghania corrubedonensis]|uniref:Peptidase M23-like protein n=1 Tax=Breoghania corrubedonensis TaxID=665038 RepID=A0A2T5V8K2_9HYPH|nr:M23 family metallopeptidase [Breoghania corrubedonensis]PTW60088.1 peptidase M23-like protein [Breoghania corrubedonensis]